MEQPKKNIKLVSNKNSRVILPNILTLIGVSVASQKRRGGVGVNIAIGLGLVFVYIFAMKMLTVATLNLGFPALLSVWVPNIFFAFIALILFKAAQK